MQSTVNINRKQASAIVVVLVLGILAILAVGCGTEIDDDLQVGGNLAGLKDLALKEAARFSAEIADDEPGWKSHRPSFGTCHPLYASQDATPDHFECQAVCGAAPCGSVIVDVSTAHAEVLQWTTDGEGFVAPMMDRIADRDAVAAVRPVRFTALDFALEVAYRDGTDAVLFNTRPLADYQRAKLELRKTAERRIAAARQQLAPRSDLQGGSDIRARRQALGAGGYSYSRSVPGSSVCGSSPVPCYTQFWSSGCISGCTPVAVAMVLGYWDLRGYTRLIPGSATSSANARGVIWRLHNLMGTSCSGSTSPRWSNYNNVEDYTNDEQRYSFNVDLDTYGGNDTLIFNAVKYETDRGRPATMGINAPLSNYNGHTVATYGYRKYRYSWRSSINRYIRMNTGWSSPSTTTAKVSASSFNLKNMAKFRP